MENVTPSCRLSGGLCFVLSVKSVGHALSVIFNLCFLSLSASTLQIRASNKLLTSGYGASLLVISVQLR